MKILFLHGWKSVPGGVKPTYLKDHGHEVINPELPDEDFAEAVRIAQAEFDKHRPQVVVGSSRGGAVAMNIDSGDAKLVLLCPAWKKYGTARTVKPGTVILHSRADDVVPFADCEELVKNSGLPAQALIEVGSDHRLADPEPLARCCGRVVKLLLCPVHIPHLPFRMRNGLNRRSGINLTHRGVTNPHVRCRGRCRVQQGFGRFGLNLCEDWLRRRLEILERAGHSQPSIP